MSASLDTLQPVVQSIVTAINSQTQNTIAIAGVNGSYGIKAATVVKTGQGRIANISVIVAGAQGMIYDASATGVISGPICIIPATLGVIVINMPFTSGLVVAPGAGQTVSVSYSP